MDDNETAFFERFYQTTMYARRADEWEISLAEWLRFWENHHLRSYKREHSRCVSLYRQDERHPWSIPNLRVITRDELKSRATLASQPTEPGSRTLTVAEWISEVRG